jgi:large subunit ribosomal protein L25
LVVDLDGLEIGTSIKISSISLPENVKPTIQGRDFVVATVAAPTVFKEPEKPAEEAATEGAEGAEGGVEGAEGTTTEAAAKEGGDKAPEGEKGKEDPKKDQKAPAEKK